MALVRPKNIPTSNLNGTISASQIGQLDFNNASIGSIIQVKTGELSSRVVYNQQSFGDIGLSVNITPTSASNKIFIIVTLGRFTTTQSNLDHGCGVRLLRNGVDSDLNGIQEGSRPRSMFNIAGNSYNGDHNNGGYSCAGIDSPATTSTITYKVQAWNQSSVYPLIINGTSSNGDSYQFYNARTKCIITAMEIKQ